jgi:hypothetical protein
MTVSNKILRIKDGKFYYTENDFIDIRDTNISGGKMSFRNDRDIFWEVELFNYNILTKTIRVRVLNYSPENISNYYKQKQKKPVKSFLFEKFEWSKIEPQLSYYQTSALSNIIKGIPSLDNTNNENLKIEKRFNNSDFNSLGEPKLLIDNKNIEFIENQIVKIDEELSFYYKNANFKDGFVSVNFKPKLCSNKEEIKIFNNKILPEYEYVKNYFPKYFKKGKKFKVQLSGKVQFGKLLYYEATSVEIQSINENVISTVRDLIEVDLFDTVDTDKIDKNIFSIEEIIEKSNINESIKDSIDKEPQKLLYSIIKLKDVKNKKQLEYLAGFKHKGNYQLRFTLKPLFGFLFYVESGKKNHFCWELLNSHATYIWSFDSKYDFFEKLYDIDVIINYIRINGRKKYKQFTRNEIENNFTFKTIFHKNKLTEFKDGFIEWKNELEKVMKKNSG